MSAPTNGVFAHLPGVCKQLVIAIVVVVVPADVVREVHAAGAVASLSGVRQRRDRDNDNDVVTVQLGGAGTPLVRPGRQ